MRFIDRPEVTRRLTYPLCLPIIRDAMIAFSTGLTKQHLRSILPLSEGRLFGIMPGALGPHSPFGAKLISVFHGNAAKGIQSHQGIVLLFDPESGAPVCVAHAGEITAIRTAAATAVATDALARPDATTLAILGTGEQARTHARALSHVRPLTHIHFWGRSHTHAQSLAKTLSEELQIPTTAHPTVAQATQQADIITTVTAAHDPILFLHHVRPGTHINAVGSSYAGPSEIDIHLVAQSRFIADSREGALAQGAEFLYAKQAGLIDDSHIAGEIGQVLASQLPGRQSPTQITLYKSLGHIVQDLAATWALFTLPDSLIES